MTDNFNFTEVSSFLNKAMNQSKSITKNTSFNNRFDVQLISLLADKAIIEFVRYITDNKTRLNDVETAVFMSAIAQKMMIMVCSYVPLDKRHRFLSNWLEQIKGGAFHISGSVGGKEILEQMKDNLDLQEDLDKLEEIDKQVEDQLQDLNLSYGPRNFSRGWLTRLFTR